MINLAQYAEINSEAKKAQSLVFNANTLFTKKCSNLSAFNSDYIDTHLREWECSRCKENTLSLFPFYSIEDNYELLNLSFNSTYSCKCNSTEISIADYSRVKQLEFCKLTHQFRNRFRQT